MTRPAVDANLTPANFGDLLQRFRRAAGLTQEALAERAGISVRGVSDLERGIHAAPRRDTLALILDALDLAPEERAALLAAARRRGRPRMDTMRLGVEQRAALFGAASLPAYLDELIGREEDVAALAHQLEDARVRLLTVSGPGGIGKTRLAVAVAERVRESFTEGAAYVPLAAVRDPELVIPTIAQALGVREIAGLSIDDGLAGALAGRQMLLVLDNLEQVLPAGPRLARLVAAAPSLTMLVTSRAPLRVAGEVRYPLAPLALPPLASDGALPPLAQHPAVALFVRRAADIDPAFALTGENAGAIASVCQRLDGVPLAIELAAARSVVLSPAALLQRLDRALPLLTRGSQDAPDRQRTLRDAIAWSYELLTAAEQCFFRRLGAFVGGFTLEAAEAVGGTEDPGETIDQLTALIEQSLVQALVNDGLPRYTMLEAIREFAAEALAHSDERDAIARRHAWWFRALVLDAKRDFWGPAHSMVSRRLGREIGNLRVALDWLLRQEDVQPVGQMILLLSRFWYGEARIQEMVTWAERAAARIGAFPMPERALLMASRVYGLNMQSSPDALPLALDAVSLLREFRSSPAFDPVHLGIAVMLCGNCIEEARDQKPFYEEAVALFRAAGTEDWLAISLANVGGSYYEAGEWDRAVAAFNEAMALYRKRGYVEGLAFAQTYFASILRKHGDALTAAEHYRGAIMVHAEIGALWEVAVGLEGLAAIIAPVAAERASWLFGAAANLRLRCGATTEPEWWGRTPEVIAALRDSLGDAEFAMIHAAGEAAPMTEIINQAMEVTAP